MLNVESLHAVVFSSPHCSSIPRRLPIRKDFRCLFFVCSLVFIGYSCDDEEGGIVKKTSNEILLRVTLMCWGYIAAGEYTA